jgi:hypothetical protein
MPMGLFLLGSAYHLLHQASGRLRARQRVGHFGGPWWFIQFWLNLYCMKINELQVLSAACPDTSIPESDEQRTRRCTSFGEAVSTVGGDDLSAGELAHYFELFYFGIAEPLQVWFAYGEAQQLEHPYRFRVETPFRDAESWSRFRIFITPGALPTGLAMTKDQTFSYEFYHPATAARQLGMGQLPMKLSFVGAVACRVALLNTLEWRMLDRVVDTLFLGYINTSVWAPIETELFKQWWAGWRQHLFVKNCSHYCSRLDPSYEAPIDEVSSRRNHLSDPVSCIQSAYLLFLRRALRTRRKFAPSASPSNTRLRLLSRSSAEGHARRRHYSAPAMLLKSGSLEPGRRGPRGRLPLRGRLVAPGNRHRRRHRQAVHRHPPRLLPLTCRWRPSHSEACHR